MGTRHDRYHASDKGRATGLTWRRANREKLKANKRRHRQRMREMKEIGDALRERFPEFTATGEGGAAQPSGSPAAGGVRSRSRSVRSDATGSALPPPAAHPLKVRDDGV